MAENFDAYHKWLGIPPEDQPPNHYRLLGIKVLETDPDVISTAADRQMAHIRGFQGGEHSALSQRLLNEISAARICLLNAEKKRQYDARLQSVLPPPPRPPVAKREDDARRQSDSPVPPNAATKTGLSPAKLAVAGAGGACLLALIVFATTRSGPEPTAAVAPANPPAAPSSAQADQPNPTTEANAAPTPGDATPASPENPKPEVSSSSPSANADSAARQTSQPSEEKEPLPWAALTQHLNDLSHWTIKEGNWKAEDGEIIGSDASTLVFNHLLPHDFLLEVTVNVISGMRPRIYLPGFYVGNEDKKVLSLQGIRGKGAGFSYENEQDMRIRVVAQGRRVQLYVNESLVRQGNGRNLKGAQLSIAGGDSSSRGTTSFSEFRIGPPSEAAALASAAKTEKEPSAKEEAPDPSPAATPSSEKSRDASADTPAMLAENSESASKTAPSSDAPADKPDGATPPSAKQDAANQTPLLSRLKRKLHGRVAYDPKTERVALTYDWTSKQQLQDFDVSKARLELVHGRLMLQGGESLRHVVDFKEVAVETLVYVEKVQGTLIRASGGATFSLGHAHYFPGGGIFIFVKKGKRSEAAIPKPQRSGVQPLLVTISPKRLAFAYGVGKPTQLGRAVSDFHAGQLELHGGDVGFQYGKLVLSGKIDEKWLKSNLEGQADQGNSR